MEGSPGVITISSLRGSVQFDDQGVTVRNLFSTDQIGWAEVRRFTDGMVTGSNAGDWALAVVCTIGELL